MSTSEVTPHDRLHLLDPVELAKRGRVAVQVPDEREGGRDEVRVGVVHEDPCHHVDLPSVGEKACAIEEVE